MTSNCAPLVLASLVRARLTASRASATASSGAEGSKRMFGPAETTRRVMGGAVEGGYSGTAAAQSSLNSGSSSAVERRAGRRVERRARWVVRERRGRG